MSKKTILFLSDLTKSEKFAYRQKPDLDELV